MRVKKSKKRPSTSTRTASASNYSSTLKEVVLLLETARRTSARAVNAVMTATYWEVGRRIVHFEQKGAKKRAEYYGKQLVENLAIDLTQKFGRGFGKRNLYQMRAFYTAFPQKIVQTVSAQSFPLPWSHYVKLLSVENQKARLSPGF